MNSASPSGKVDRPKRIDRKNSERAWFGIAELPCFERLLRLLERVEKAVPVDRDRLCEEVAGERRAFGAGACVEGRHVIALQSSRRRFFHLSGKRCLGFKWRPFPRLFIELFFEHLVIKKSHAGECQIIRPGDLLHHRRRIEQPIAIVLPIVGIVGELLGDTTAYGVDVVHIGGGEPIRPLDDFLVHVAGRYHRSLSRPPVLESEKLERQAVRQEMQIT
jgi:hypothetical protein